MSKWGWPWNRAGETCYKKIKENTISRLAVKEMSKCQNFRLTTEKLPNLNHFTHLDQ